MRSGIIPDWKIKELIKKGVIKNADLNLVNPSSLDLRLDKQRYKLIGSFLPLQNQNIEDVLKYKQIVDDSSLKDEFYVEHSQPYAMKLVESLDLPESISARLFNKSGRGRIAISSKGLTDKMTQFDFVRNGYKGDIHAEITSTSFPLVVYSGETSIPQIRFYEGNPQSLRGSDLELLLRKNPILTDDKGDASYNEREKREMIKTGKLTFTAEISKEGLVAYKAKKDRRTLDLSKRGEYDPTDYFEEINLLLNQRRMIVIHPGEFVLINSKQNIRLPPIIAAEIDEYSPELGDMKSHYAGLINASHGYDLKNPNTPAHIVFEIRARDVPLIIQDGQPLAKFNLYNMLETPEENYVGKNSTGFGDLKSILPTIFNKK